MNRSSNWPKPLNFLRAPMPVIIVHLLCFVLMMPLVYAGFYAHPSGADDFSYATWSHFQSGFTRLYLGFGGRYFSTLLVLLGPLHWHSILGNRLACLLILIGFLGTYYSFIKSLLIRFTTIGNAWAGSLAAITVLVILNHMSSPDESFFWYTAAVTYTVPAILFAWLMMLLMRLETSPKSGLRLTAYLLALAICGGNEMISLLLLCLLWALWLGYKKQGFDSFARFYRNLFLLSIMGLTIFLISPGNYVRIGTQRHEWFMVFPNWIYFTQRELFRWISDPVLIFFSAAVLLFFSSHPLRRPHLSLWAAFLLPFGVTYLFVLPCQIMVGSQFYPRVANTVFIFFLMAWLIFLLHLATAIHEVSKDGFAKGKRSFVLVAAAIFLATISGLSRIPRPEYGVVMTIRSLAMRVPQRYDAELKARYQMIRAGGDTVLLPPLTTKDENPLYFLDITTDPSNPQNKYYAQWWGKKAIALSRFQ
ncbi:MAG: hypothetical protein JST06_05500 [Bacteroidetes bacterium]|nr:hypothetical protein [Bacteroidota bacterium]